MSSRKDDLEAQGYCSVAREDEIKEGRPFMLRWDERNIALYRVDGRYYATDGICPHAAGPLAAGDLERHEIVCPLHGWSFDIRTGRCTNVEGMDIEAFDVQVVDGELYLPLAKPS